MAPIALKMANFLPKFSSVCHLTNCHTDQFDGITKVYHLIRYTLVLGRLVSGPFFCLWQRPFARSHKPCFLIVLCADRLDTRIRNTAPNKLCVGVVLLLLLDQPGPQARG